MSCERCLPLYNNRTWLPGSYLPYPTGSANECQSKSRDVANVSVDHAKVHGGPIVVCLLLMLKWSWAALSFCFVVLALFELINIQILMNIVSVVTMGDSQVLGSFCRSHYASYRILQDASVTITPSAVRTTLTSVMACVTTANTTRVVSSANNALTACIVTTHCPSPVQTFAQVGKRRDVVCCTPVAHRSTIVIKLDMLLSYPVSSMNTLCERNNTTIVKDVLRFRV